MSDNDFELDGAGMLDAILMASAAADDKKGKKRGNKNEKIYSFNIKK